MAAAIDRAPRNHLDEGSEDSMGARTIPIITPTIQMSAPSPGEPMDITTPTNSSAPQSATKSPDSDVNASGGNASNESNERLQPIQAQINNNHHNHQASSENNIIMPAPVAAAPAVHQPKIVQTAFIHKLYKYGASPIHSYGHGRILNHVIACWKTRRSSTSFLGPRAPRAS